jgi:FkbM family methyltransferase
MKKYVKQLLIVLFTPLFNKLGFVKYAPKQFLIDDKQTLLDTFYHNLKAIGFSPKHIVDIGANRGTWTREALKHFPDAYYTLIEPQARLKTYMEDMLQTNPKITLHNVGAGSQNGTFAFTIVDRDDSCNFLITKEEALANGFDQQQVEITTLNELLKNSSLPFPDLIKIDAEGLDLDVLQGASDFLGKTEVVLVEAAVFNKTMPNTTVNIISFMDDYGYSLFDITDLNRPFKPSLLWLIELAFVKKGGIIDSYKLI